jgi:hypothetical protein
MSSDFVDLLRDWGLGGVMGMGGCYLIVGSIAGKIIPIGTYIPPIRLRIKQRVLLALFGFMLALPIIWSSYGQVIYGTRGRLFRPPETAEKVVTSKVSDRRLESELLINSVQLASSMDGSRPAPRALTRGGESCPVVESFGLDQRNIRRLKFEPFQGRVFVYVGDVHSVLWKTTKLFIVIGEGDSWPSSGKIEEADFYRRFNKIPNKNKVVLEVHRSGELTFFAYAGRRYRLTVTEVYAVLLGADKISIEICELQESGQKYLTGTGSFLKGRLGSA